MQNHHRLLLGNWNVLTLRKRVGIAKRGKKYHLDIVGVSSIKRRGSEIVDLDDWWKLFYSGADPSISAQAGVAILTSPRLTDGVLDWIPLRPRACMLKLKAPYRSLYLLQVYAPNTSEYQAFVNNVNYALQRVGSTECTILLEDFNAHIGADSETWKA